MKTTIVYKKYFIYSSLVKRRTNFVLKYANTYILKIMIIHIYLQFYSRKNTVHNSATNCSKVSKSDFQSQNI